MAEFKHLDIEGLPEGWEAAHFGELVNYALGRTPPRNEAVYWKDGTYPWVSISDMEPYGTVTSTSEKVTALAFEKVFRGQLVPEGSLLMSFKLTIGRIARLGMPALHNEAIISFRPQHKKVNEDYLAYYLSQINYADYQDKAIKGHTLNKGKIDALEIALPPVAEQQRIAQVLSTVQAAIEQQERLIRTTTELKQALMQKLFTEGLRGEAQKETEIGLVPESWEVSTVGDHCAVLNGFAFKSEDYVTANGILNFRVVNINWDGTVSLDNDRKYLPKQFAQSYSDYLLNEGDILFVMVGATRGKLAQIPKEALPALMNQNMWRIVPETKVIDRKFLYYYLNRAVEKLLSEDEDQARGFFKKADFRAIRLPLPPLDVQQEIAEVIGNVDTRISQLRRKSDTLQALFRTLLHELMTGKVRVTQFSIQM